MAKLLRSDRGKSVGERPFHVLVAEEDAVVLRLIEEGLSRDGFRVTIATSGLGFFDLLEAVVGRRIDALDLIVTDNRLPGFSGLEVVSVLRELGWAIPVIFLAKAGDEESHSENRRLGAAAVFDKPVRVADLRAAVARFSGRDAAEAADAGEAVRAARAELGCAEPDVGLASS